MENWRHVWPVETICRVMRVSPRGYRSWRTRPISQRARTDMSVLAHIREQYSPVSYTHLTLPTSDLV